jgi:hypothetical protein
MRLRAGGLGVEASRARLSCRGLAELDQGQEPEASGHDAGHAGVWVISLLAIALSSSLFFHHRPRSRSLNTYPSRCVMTTRNLIRDLCPKASATLARRCIQGMIRDFCKINRRTLDLEIQALRIDVDAGNAPRGVTPESVDGIDVY